MLWSEGFAQKCQFIWTVVQMCVEHFLMILLYVCTVIALVSVMQVWNESEPLEV